MTTTSMITVSFRIAQLIPVILVLIPVVRSYWQRRNHINGLRKIRLALILMLSAIIFTNIYLIGTSILGLSRATPPGFWLLIIDKIVGLVSFWGMFLLFRHASKHDKEEKEDGVKIKKE